VTRCRLSFSTDRATVLRASVSLAAWRRADQRRPSSSTKHHAVVLVAERKEGKVVPPIRGPGVVDLNKLPRWLPSLLLLRGMANKYSHQAAWLMWQTAAWDGPFTTELTPASLAAPRPDDPFGSCVRATARFDSLI